MHTFSPLRTVKLHLTSEQPSKDNVRSRQKRKKKKKNPCPRAKENPQQDRRRDEIAFRIKHLTHQRHSEGSNKSCVHQDPETPQRLSHNCVWMFPAKVQVNSSLLQVQGQGLWVQQTWVWHKPSWRRLPLTPPQSLQNLQRTGEMDSWKAQIKPCAHQDPGERRSDPTETDPQLPVSVQESPMKVWVTVVLLQGQGHCVPQCLHRKF